jgi:hypothetical protein
MITSEKRLLIETWKTARTDMMTRIRGSIRIAQASGLPDSEIRIAIMAILENLPERTDR